MRKMRIVSAGSVPVLVLGMGLATATAASAANGNQPRVIQAAPSGAATGPRPGVFGRAGDNHAAPKVTGALGASLGSGVHYLYAQDGTCPDGIDVYKVSGTSLTHIQAVSAGCSSIFVFPGAHHLAVVRTPANCLIFDDADGNVYSFTITPSTGMLSAAPASSASVGLFPGDLAVSGSTVFESNVFNSTIDVLTVGSGCALTLQSQNVTGGNPQYEADINIALASPTTVVSTDNNSGAMVAYTLQPGNTLKETVNDPGQITSPDGVAVLNDGADVYTGQAVFAPPQTQGFSFDGSAFIPLAGSPQTSTDPNAVSGEPVAGSSKNHLLAQADSQSGQIGWDSLAGGRMSYTGDTPLAVNGAPIELTVAGDNLFVAQALGGDIEDCTLAPNSVSNCHTVATTTGASSGNYGSVAIFS